MSPRRLASLMLRRNQQILCRAKRCGATLAGHPEFARLRFCGSQRECTQMGWGRNERS